MFRQKLLFGIFLLGFFFIIARLFYWQILQGARLAEAASDQYYFKLNLTPNRGEIITSDGSPLVANIAAYLVYAEPQKITDTKDFSEKVGEALTIDEATISARINQENIVWAPLAHKVDQQVVDPLKEAGIEGLGFEPESKRFYPESSMAAHLVGFVGSDENGSDTGYFGLEGFYDRALKGKPGSLIQEKDARGIPILLGSSRRIAAEDGQTLRLYLDRSVQHIAEERLKQALEKYGAKAGLVAIMDPKTGGILASASYPNFDPRQFAEFDKDLYTDPLVGMTYEPGSTFKTLIMSAALNEKLVTPTSIFDETGPVPIGQYRIKTWNDKYNGELTMTQVLEKSSNPGMVHVGQKLGKDRLYNYIEAFGFGKKTGIDLEGEEAAPIRPRDQWREIDQATASFGQGIAVTPIQMLRAVSALANEGTLMEPHMVASLIDPAGKVTEVPPKKETQVISPASAHVITEMMISAVNNGDAKWAKPKGYRIAGKTGTAQIPIAGHYDSDKTIASFVGFAPADNPRFVMLVVIREPTSSPWGSETAAPLFFTIAKELFSYYGISPND
ncbi:penicillin-binding protein 2 [Candidatus Microgenomates bacterium]|nr:MAG: penicillin-binding protein 2 [Candidatus Microgenomates bacterium]